MTIRHFLHSMLLFGSISIGGFAHATIINQTLIGTWDTDAAGASGIVAGQKYVIKIEYDDTSTVTPTDVLNSFFAPSGQQVGAVNLTDTGNSLNILVPMEGLDSGSPFIYTQNEGNHLPLFVPAPTLNFLLGSNISNTANIVGIEFEGDFAPDFATNPHIIELFNTAADAMSPINQVGQILTCADSFCVGSAVTASETNGLVAAVDVMVNDDTVTYDAGTLTQTTNTSPTSNDLGANRTDGETFLDSTWTEGGGPLTGTLQANGVDIAVAIADSGLTNTTSSTSWDVEVTEQMTGLGDTASVVVDYANAAPTSNLTATANATGYDFSFTSDDVDLMVNALILGFEALSVTSVLVDGVATALFGDLINTGMQALTLAELAVFGSGVHTLQITVADLAGLTSISSATFDVGDVSPIPVPPAFGLMLIALGFLGATGAFKRRSHSTA